jgi:hypothetical protein
MNSADLGKIFGLSKRRVDQLADEGVLVRGAAGFDLEDSTRRYIKFLRTDEESRKEKRLLVQAQTKVTELRAKRQTRELLSRAEVRRMLAGHIGALMDFRVVAAWLYTEIHQSLGEVKAKEICSSVHSSLCGLIVKARDDLEALFADERPTDLDNELKRLDVHSGQRGPN